MEDVRLSQLSNLGPADDDIFREESPSEDGAGERRAGVAPRRRKGTSKLDTWTVEEIDDLLEGVYHAELERGPRRRELNRLSALRSRLLQHRAHCQLREEVEETRAVLREALSLGWRLEQLTKQIIHKVDFINPEVLEGIEEEVTRFGEVVESYHLHRAAARPLCPA